MIPRQLSLLEKLDSVVLLTGSAKRCAIEQIKQKHYTHCVPSGKSWYMRFGDAIVVWSIPANKNISHFLFRKPAKVLELSRLWAPDNHEKNLLSRAISAATGLIVRLAKPDLLVSYADPNVGHSGGVYRAASWILHGVSSETRGYEASNGRRVARRSFHSGGLHMNEGAIEAIGYKKIRLKGKLRFIRPISRMAKTYYEKNLLEMSSNLGGEETSARIVRRSNGQDQAVQRLRKPNQEAT